jgi:hypothetical protein
MGMKTVTLTEGLVQALRDIDETTYIPGETVHFQRHFVRYLIDQGLAFSADSGRLHLTDAGRARASEGSLVNDHPEAGGGAAGPCHT